MAENNFFGMMDIWVNIAWVTIFFVIVVVLWILHHRKKREIERRTKQ